MAILTAQIKAGISQNVADTQAVTWNKTEVYAATQAIEDYWENTARAAIGAAMEAAAPSAFTNAEKKKIGKHWLKYKFGVE